MSAAATTYADWEGFLADERADTLIVRDGLGLIWTSFETESGDWLALRSRNEDDDKGPDGDEWRPLGPISLESIPFPIRCADAHEVLAVDGCTCGAVEYGAMAQHLAPCAAVS